MITKTLRWTQADRTILEESGTITAQVLITDPIALATQSLDQFTDQTIVIPCGQHSPIDPEPSNELLIQWSQDSWEPFNDAIESLRNQANAVNTKLVILPGAGGRLSDAICTLSWATAHPDIPLLIDPVRWLTPSMMPDLTDHLIRSSDLCKELPNIWGVAVSSTSIDTDGRITPELINRTARSIPTPRLIECK
jgi:hypothetical protein